MSRIAAILLCFCMVMSGLIGPGKAMADYDPVIDPDLQENKTVRNYAKESPLESTQVTLLAGENGEVRGKTVQATIDNYRAKYLLGVAADFCVFLHTYFWPTQSDAEGRVAVGGDIYADTPWALNYTVGAGDFYWHAPLDNLLVANSPTVTPNRTGAATVILGGMLYGQLNDTYYSDGESGSSAITEKAFRAKYEAGKGAKGYQDDNHHETVLTPEKKSAKLLVLNRTEIPYYSDLWKALSDTKYTPPDVPFPEDASYWSGADWREADQPIPYWWNSTGNYQKIDSQQTYVTKLINFDDSFAYLSSVSNDMKDLGSEFTVNVSNTHYGRYDKSEGARVANGSGNTTITFTYTGTGVNKDCVYLTLTHDEYEAFKNATYVEFENIPKLSEPRWVVDVRDKHPEDSDYINHGDGYRDDIYMRKWETAYVIINALESGTVAIADINRANGQKFTTINGEYISRYGEADSLDDWLWDAAVQRNNHAGVTSLLYNFPNASTVVIGNNFQGTIFAPDADVTDAYTLLGKQNNNADNQLHGHLSGALVANSFKGATEFGYRPYSGPVLIDSGIDGSLKLSKSVVNSNTTDQFTFTVRLIGYRVGDAEVGTEKKLGDMTFKVTADGDSVATVLLGAGESATATGIPVGIEYEITESGVSSDFEVTYNKKHGTITATGTGTTVEGSIEKPNQTDEVRFINTMKISTGDLKVEKSVTGEVESPAPEFSFKVTVTKDGVGISGTYDGVTFTNGEATITVKAGESKTITGLPEGATYTVVEQPKDGYEQDEDSTTGTTGTITAGSTVTASFVNAKITEKTGSLTVSKQVTGASESTDTFTFTVTVTKDGEGINGTYDGVNFVKGVATVTVTAGESKTISGLPVDATYTVVEQSKEGYEQVSATGVEGTIPADGNEEAVFVNAKKEDSDEEDKFGSLTVSKQVTGASETTDTFTFTVTVMKDGEGINGTYDGVNFVNGVATVTVTAGESKTISGLPADATYTVVEQAKEGYEQVSATGAEGTIPADGNEEAAFVNAKKEDREEEDKFGSLTVSKQVTGASESTDTFTFTVTVTKDGEGINGAYDGVNFVNGVATITVTAGESKTISGLPADATYTVVEQAKEGYKQVSATGATGTIPADGKAQASFINAKDSIEDDDGNEEEATGHLIVSKQVSGNVGDKTKAFSFTVLLSDTGINGVYGDMTFSGGVATFTLKHGESKAASGLPEGIRYSVSEALADQDGYTTTSVGDRGTITADETATAIFINTKDDAVSDMPQTGDNSRLELWVALMLAAMAMMYVCIFANRKQNQNKR